MRNFINNKNEDGVVLITSMLFLLVVTLLAVSSLQAPKTDLMIVGNQKFMSESQQLANMGVMEGKNWLEMNRKDGETPFNRERGGEISIETVAGNRPPVRNLTIRSSIYGTKVIGQYSWKIIRLTEVGNNLEDGIGSNVSEDEFDTFIDDLKVNSFSSNTASVIDKFLTKGGGVGIVEDDIENGNEGVFQHFYVFSEGKSGPGYTVRGNSEAIVKYKDIQGVNIGYK